MYLHVCIFTYFLFLVMKFLFVAMSTKSFKPLKKDGR